MAGDKRRKTGKDVRDLLVAWHEEDEGDENNAFPS
jgi:hypothetical protein